MVAPRSALLPCAVLGVAGGMRTFLPVTAAGRHSRPHSRSTQVAGVAAAGELVFDKLPQAPSRLDPPGLAGRAISSAIGGATLRGASGALAAVLAALATAPAAHYARRAVGRSTGTPDWALGVLEDAVAITLAVTAIRLAAAD